MHAYIHVHTYVHRYICIHMFIGIYAYICSYICIHMYLHTHTYTYTYIYIHTYIGTYKYTRTYVYIQTYLQYLSYIQQTFTAHSTFFHRRKKIINSNQRVLYLGKITWANNLPTQTCHFLCFQTTTRSSAKEVNESICLSAASSECRRRNRKFETQFAGKNVLVLW
jgi:hypothetical protein